MTTSGKQDAAASGPVKFADGGEFPGGKEIAYVLTGECLNGVWHAKMRWRTKGSETSVRFDGKRVLAREEAEGDVIGFYHTHPEGFTGPSGRDDRTLDAWCFCFGKPILCVIETSAGARGWIYEYEKKPRAVARVQRFKGLVLVAVE
jgi:hypothetical protein